MAQFDAHSSDVPRKKKLKIENQTLISTKTKTTIMEISYHLLERWILLGKLSRIYRCDTSSTVDKFEFVPFDWKNNVEEVAASTKNTEFMYGLLFVAYKNFDIFPI